MKKDNNNSPIVFFLCVFILLFSLTAGVNAQWIKQSPIPTHKEIRDACYISPDTGWIFGNDGTVFMTDDAGLNWTDRSVDSYNEIHHGVFTDSDHGWVAMSNYLQNEDAVIYGTSDGGISWELQFVNTLFGIRDLDFIDSLSGWALCYYRNEGPEYIYCNFFLKTMDGGDNWIMLDTLDYSNFYHIDFIDASLGYMAGYGPMNLARTLDGGLTWDSVAHISSQEITALEFTDAANGFTCGNRFYYTHDSAATWAETYCSSPILVDMCNENTGWTANYHNVYKVTEGGATVSLQLTDDKSLLIDLAAPDEDHAVVTGRYVDIFSTNDGGENWHEISNGTNYDLGSVYFLDENIGWAGGYYSSVLRTYDGGDHWISDHNLTGQESVSNLQFINPDTGWCIRSSVMYTLNGGKNWYYGSGLPSYNIFDLHFVNFNAGWCVGAAGRIYKSENGGYSWVQKPVVTDRDLFAVYFATENTGYVAGEGIVLKTTDGGETWEESYLSFSEFTEIQFFDENTGYILSSHLYLKTYTGGEYWHVIHDFEIFGYANFADMHFLNPTEGFILGYDLLLKTTDGGETWTEEPEFPDLHSYEVFFTDPMNGWLVGEDGRIYHTTTGGTVGIKDADPIPGRERFRVSPNPASDKVLIEFQPGLGREARIEIFTLQGKMVFNAKPDDLPGGKYTMTWDAGHLPAGVYICRLTTDRETAAQKIILVK
jgi:photosystem II stability/assembly factor-like uncharacterized protein